MNPSNVRTDGARTARRAPTCRHCGVPSPAGEFCCAGCAYVYRMIHDAGLDAYYRIKDDVTTPADAVLATRDFGWLEGLQAEAEVQSAADGQDVVRLTLAVQGLSCAGCVWLIERVFSKEPGAGRIDINAQTGQLQLTWRRGEFSAARFAQTLQKFNYLLGPPGSAAAEVAESRVLVRRIGLCTAFAMNVMLFAFPAYFGMEASFTYAGLFNTLAMVFGTLSLLAGGGYFLASALRALRERLLHIDLPIALGIVGAYLGSFYGWITGQEEYLYFDFVSGFILLMLIGRWAQVAAVERNQRRLLRHQPTPPRVKVFLPDGAEREIAPDQLRPGDVLAVPMGQNVPVESRLESGEAIFSLAWINGESDARVFKAGQTVPAGAQNVTRSEVRLVARQAWDKSLLAQLLKPVSRAAYRHRVVERVIQGYLVGIFAVAALAGAWWWWHSGDWLHTGAVVTAILVVSCPCALGLACPLTDEMATVALRRRGVFVRNADLWPRLGQVRKLVFDKTGTLTLETPVLQNPAALRQLAPETRAALYSLVADNPHPVSRALFEALVELGSVEAVPGAVVEEVGRGVVLGEWSLGRAGWRDEDADGDATVLSRAGRVVARFQFADTARMDAPAEICALRQRGLAVHILSGDRQEKVTALATALGLARGDAKGECSPQGKADWLQAQGADDVLMLGDGANDSLAFDAALCRGTPVVHRGVLEQKADFYYLGRGVAGLRALFEVNDARARTHVLLIVFMIAYNVAAVGLAVVGWMNPLFAAVLMPLSSLATLAIVGMGMRHVWQVTRAVEATPPEPALPVSPGAPDRPDLRPAVA